MSEYSVERSETTSWTESKRYVIKKGRKEVLKLHDPKEAEMVCNYLNQITNGKKKKPAKKAVKKEEAKSEKKD